MLALIILAAKKFASEKMAAALCAAAAFAPLPALAYLGAYVRARSAAAEVAACAAIDALAVLAERYYQPPMRAFLMAEPLVLVAASKSHARQKIAIHAAAAVLAAAIVRRDWATSASMALNAIPYIAKCLDESETKYF